MAFDEQSLNSAPTMVQGGSGAVPAAVDEPSFGSAPTMAPGGPGTVSATPSLGRIDQYELIRKLGEGGFGVVYLAHDTVSDVDVALKTLHPLLKRSPEEMGRLREKFKLVSRLTHTNIAKALVLHPVRDIVVTDDEVRRELRLFPGDFMMVMDYAPGVTLSKWRRKMHGGVVPPALAVEVGRQIASALDYAHGERIIHRDIKPSNMMVEDAPQPSSPKADKKLRVRILDFGLAAQIRSSMSMVSNETCDTSGTRPYMAPEQWQGRKQDGRTDQYALACVLYELLSGEPPFAGVFETGDLAIMRESVLHDVPEEIEGVPPAMNAALRKALSKNPQDRFASCGALVEALGHPAIPGGSRSGATAAGEPPAPPGGAASGRARRDAAHPNAGEPPAFRHESETPPFLPQSESEVLRRRLSFAETLKAVSEADRADDEFSKFINAAEKEMAVVEEACTCGRFAAAAESLDRVESALDDLRKARFEREMAERKARDKAEAERRTREEAERRAREEAERRAREEAERRAREEAERRAREEAEAERKAWREVEVREAPARRAREEAVRIARECEEERARGNLFLRKFLFVLLLFLLFSLVIKSCFPF